MCCPLETYQRVHAVALVAAVDKAEIGKRDVRVTDRSLGNVLLTPERIDISKREVQRDDVTTSHREKRGQLKRIGRALKNAVEKIGETFKKSEGI